jgi:hypothetical protein
MTLEGTGQHKVAETLNRESVPVFVNGKQWHRSFIAKLLGYEGVMGTFVSHTVERVGKQRVRKPAVRVPNYYPTIVDPETFSAVQALQAVRSPMRGRHASTGIVNNILGGLARCPVCDSTMTLVNKGHRTNKYLVCTKAKAGAGCEYKAVKYAAVEAAVLDEGRLAVNDVPTGNTAYDNEVQEVRGAILGIEDKITELLSTLNPRQSAAVAARLRELETELEALREKELALLKRRDTIYAPVLARRLDQLNDAMREAGEQMTPERRAKVNFLLRQLLSKAVVDHRNGTLEFMWVHGEYSPVRYREPSPLREASLR